MIESYVLFIDGDMLSGSVVHMAFMISNRGYQSSWFARKVSHKVWPEVASIGAGKLGEVHSHKGTRGKTFFALTCYSRSVRARKVPKTLKKCLDRIEIPKDELIAFVLKGFSFLNARERDTILDVLDKSERRFVVFT